jgi:hypothetical protein
MVVRPHPGPQALHGLQGQALRHAAPSGDPQTLVPCPAPCPAARLCVVPFCRSQGPRCVCRGTVRTEVRQVARLALWSSGPGRTLDLHCCAAAILSCHSVPWMVVLEPSTGPRRHPAANRTYRMQAKTNTPTDLPPIHIVPGPPLRSGLRRFWRGRRQVCPGWQLHAGRQLLV